MLQGTIPSEIGQLSSIEDLWLYVSKVNLKTCPNDADMSFQLHTKLLICCNVYRVSSRKIILMVLFQLKLEK